MKDDLSRVIIETVVKNKLRDIKQSPERSVRNLVDMALHFSEGRFQKRFFEMAQTMLKNENSGYYRLIRNAVTHVETDRLFTFGMNLGYNGCTVGAQRIRERENQLGCMIPWTVSLTLDGSTHLPRYHDLIQEGEELGIYTWMVFTSGAASESLALAEEHPDSAFVLFCEQEDLTTGFLEQAKELFHIMLAVCYEETAADIFAQMRDMGLLYSVWYEYGISDMETILNGELFDCTQQVFPAFTVLVPEPHCPESVRRLVHQTALRIRKDQCYSTIPWELYRDNELLDAIISDDSCSITFDRAGLLMGDKDGKLNLFQHNLKEILSHRYPRTKK